MKKLKGLLGAVMVTGPEPKLTADGKVAAPKDEDVWPKVTGPLPKLTADGKVAAPKDEDVWPTVTGPLPKLTADGKVDATHLD